MLRQADRKEREATRRLFGGKFNSVGGQGLFGDDGGDAAAAATAGGQGGGKGPAVPRGGLWGALAAALEWIWGVLQRVLGVPRSSSNSGTA